MVRICACNELSRVGHQENTPAGCSKRPSSKAAASEEPEAYPLGYVEDLNDASTLLADFFGILLDNSVRSAKGTSHRHYECNSREETIPNPFCGANPLLLEDPPTSVSGWFC